MFCKYCGKELINGAKFCSQCGKMLTPSATNAAGQEEQAETKETTATVAENKKFCKHCGKEILPTVKFCPKCGNKTNISMDLSESSQSSPANQDALSQDSIQSTTEKEKINEVPQETLRANEKKFCKFCGSKVSESTMFCPKCGRNINSKQGNNIHVEKSETKTMLLQQTQESGKKTYWTTIQEPTVQENQYVESAQTEDTQKNSTNKSTFTCYEKFTVANLFVQVFKKHSGVECNEILKAGLLEQNKPAENLQPWLYSRVFIFLLALFAIFEVCLLGFYNTNVMPGLMLMGSIMIPFSLLTLYFELNVYRDISFYRTIGIFLLGGAVSLLFTLFLYQIIPVTGEFNIVGASLVSIIEEIGKTAIVIILLNKTKNVTVLQGLLIGGAIGCGFAVFESAGYAFNVYLNAHDYNTRANMLNDYLPWYSQYGYADSWGEMNFNIFIRAILAFGGHTAWAAIEGASYGKKKKMDACFVKAFASCFILHAIWDTNTPATYFKLAILCLIAWGIIIRQIANFVEENNSTLKR